jgi:hypothetical protein
MSFVRPCGARAGMNFFKFFSCVSYLLLFCPIKFYDAVTKGASPHAEKV